MLLTVDGALPAAARGNAPMLVQRLLEEVGNEADGSEGMHCQLGRRQEMYHREIAP